MCIIFITTIILTIDNKNHDSKFSMIITMKTVML